jgi:hypothetical protein
MTLDEIIEQYYNKPKEKKRDISRLWASDVYKIRKGYLTVSKFFEQSPIDKDGKSNIFWGEAGEDRLNFILKAQNADFHTQVPFEIPMEGFVISGKTDFSFPQFVLETKCPKDAVHDIPDKWKDQLEVQFRGSKKPIKLGVFYRDGNHLIKVFGYEPSDQRWEEIQILLKNFHDKLVKKYAGKTNTAEVPEVPTVDVVPQQGGLI